MNFLRSLGCRDRRFESYSRHGCLYVCAFFYVKVEALRRADHSSKESYRLCSDIYKLKYEARAQERAVEPLEKKDYCKYRVNL
jgi:hypothetical protein